MTQMGASDISVIIPTLNRVESLRATLEALARQETRGAFTYEVVVVDNGSSDDTRSVVEHLARTFPVSLRYVCETHRGRPAALNAGIHAAYGAVLAITDDDLLPHGQWLQALWRSLEEEAADAAAGRVVPEWVPERPAWIDEKVERHLNQTGLGLVDHGPERRRSWQGQDCRWVGGNMAVRRETLERLGLFDVRLVRGQDFEYYERAVAQGAKIVYEPAAVAMHRIGPDRATPGYLRAWRHRQGRYNAQWLSWKPSHLVSVMPLWRWKVSVQAVWAWWWAILTGASWWERFYSGLRLREELSTITERFRQWPGQWVAVLRGAKPAAAERLTPASEPSTPSAQQGLESNRIQEPRDISVLVATRNRAQSLAGTLTALAQQDTGGRFTYEVVVVDNGSTDQTRDVVGRARERFPVPLRYLVEPRVGKPWAINAGLRKASGSVVAFTDDDVVPATRWLSGLWTALEAEHADAVGGRIVPRWLGPQPAWWVSKELARAFINGALGCVDHGEHRLVSTPQQSHYWVGGNFAVRRQVLEELGGLDVQLARGEDSEYQQRCLRRGKRVVYEPTALVYHRIGSERLTPAYFRSWWHARGRFRAYRMPWKAWHLVTAESPSWYAQTCLATLGWAQKTLMRRPWGERFLEEVRLRERGSYWIQRVRILPAMWRAVFTKGRGILSGTVSYVDVVSGRWNGAGRQGGVLA